MHGELEQPCLTPFEAHQVDQAADLHGLLDERGHQARSGDRDIDAPVVVEEPFVLRIIHARHRPRHPELGLRKQGEHQIGLVVARCSHDDIGLLQPRLGETGELTRIGEQPFGARNALMTQCFLALVDEQDRMLLVQQLPGHRPSHGSGSGDDDPHSSSSTVRTG